MSVMAKGNAWLSAKPAKDPRDRQKLLAVRFSGVLQHTVEEVVAVEEPLEIQLLFGERGCRQDKSISITMRTPGHDRELALGVLLREGVIRDVSDVVEEVTSRFGDPQTLPVGGHWTANNVVRVELDPKITVNMATLERNFYATSSCGVCGKASLLALRTFAPSMLKDRFRISAGILHKLPVRLRQVQSLFEQTGGIHAAAIFDAEGTLQCVREDVGRHNALDKLIGASMMADSLPLRDRILLLSGRASFELMQKAVVAGIPMVAAVGAPSSLAVAIAKEFDVTLVGFLREDHFNVYNGSHRLCCGPDVAPSEHH